MLRAGEAITLVAFAVACLAPHALADSSALSEEEAAIMEEMAVLLREAEADPAKTDLVLKRLQEEYAPRLQEIIATSNSQVEPAAAVLLEASGGATQAASSQSQTHDVLYYYDDLHRLEHVVSNGTGVTFHYDDVGNRTAVTVPEPGRTIALVLGAILLCALRGMRGASVLRKSRARLGLVGRSALTLFVFLPLGADAAPGLQAPQPRDPSTFASGTARVGAGMGAMPSNAIGLAPGAAETTYADRDASARPAIVGGAPDAPPLFLAGLLGLLAIARTIRTRQAAASLRFARAPICLIVLLLGTPIVAQARPGLFAPYMGDPITLYNGAPPPPIPAGVSSSGGATHPGSAVEVTPEIAELARALRGDVDLIFEYVHNQIEFNPVFGSHKGAMGALLDKSGGDFAQASLMIALLRASGHTANYVYGTVRYTPAEVENWLGLTTSPAEAVGAWVIASGRFPFSPYNVVATTNAQPSGDLTYLDLERVWVEVDIDGTLYHFDPSFKQRVRHTGIDLAAAMGYSQSAFLSSARAGATITPTSAQNLNAGNIGTNLSTYAHNLLDEIALNHEGATLTEVVGGATIVPTNSFPRDTALPDLQLVWDTWTAEIDDFFRPCLRVSLPGLDETFYSDSLAGKRLTIFYGTGSFPAPALRLDGTLVATGTGVPVGSDQIVELEAIYPLGGSIEQAEGSTIQAGGSFLVLNGWTHTGRGSVEYHQRRHLESQATSGLPSSSEAVLGEALAVVAAKWLAEKTAVLDLATRFSNTQDFSYHNVGIVGQTSSVSLDVPLAAANFTSLENDAVAATNLFIAAGGLGSVLEGGVIEQLMPVGAVSTVELAGVANDQGQAFYEVTSSNFLSLQSTLAASYSAADMVRIQGVVDGGGTVILPINGSLTSGSWTGAGYLGISSTPDGTQLSYLISGGLKGGFSNLPYTYDPLYAELWRQLDWLSHLLSADPIDLVTGDFLYASTDLTIGSLPYPLGLGFARSYNSARRYQDGPLGLGWTHFFDVRATVGSDGFRGLGEDSPRHAVAALAGILVSFDLLLLNSSVDRWASAMLAQRWLMDELTSNTVTVSRPGESSVFVRLPDGTFSPPPASASTLEQEPDGTFLLTTKRGIEMDFGASGQIESWEDPNGNTVDFAYANGDLQTVSDAAGHTLTLTYVNDRIHQVSDGNRSFSYGYDGLGNLETVTDAESQTTTFQYVEEGLLESVFTPAMPTTAKVVNTYNELDHVETQVDPNNQLWTFYIAPGARSEEVDPDSNSKVFYFGELGDVVRSIDALEPSNETTYEYDGEGRLVRTEQPEGNSTEFEYDDRHNVTRLTHYSKPASPLVPIVRVFTYETAYNHLKTATDPRMNTTEYFYFPNGNLERVEEPQVDGETPETSYTYNSRGQILTIEDQDSMVTRFNYDPVTADLLTRTVDEGGFNLVTEYRYSPAGDVIYEEDPRGNAVTFVHDDMRRVVEVQAPAPFNYKTCFLYDEDGQQQSVHRQLVEGPVQGGCELLQPAQWQTESVTYSNSGKTRTTTDPGGQETTTTYDSLDRVETVTDALERTTTFYYTGRGELERVVDPISTPADPSESYTYTPNGLVESVTDSEGNTTQYRYDGFDRLEYIDFADQSSEQFEYDAASNVKTRTLRSNQTIVFTYDALNRPETKSAAGMPLVTYDYDLVGRLEAETIAGIGLGAGTTTHVYDTAGRLLTTTNANGYMVGYQYDGAGNRTRLDYPGSIWIRYEYDELNRLEGIFHGSSSSPFAGFEYDALSRRELITRQNGVATQFEWELDDDLMWIDHEFAGNPVRWEYLHNAVHHVRRKSVSDPQFHFDLMSLLPTTYVPNAMNQYESVAVEGAADSFAYDLNGNLTDPIANAYVFDSRNRLESATLGTGSASYTYNDSGVRTSKTVNPVGSTIDYVLDGNQVLEERDASTGALLRRYYYAGLDEPVLMATGSGSVYYYHQDAQGSVVAMSSSAGALAESYAYGPYGQVEQPSILGNPFLYTGREYDAETGLYYYRARHYDPVIGRFLQPDPLGYFDGMNVYEYVGGNPINFVDPLGLFGSLIGDPLEGWGALAAMALGYASPVDTGPMPSDPTAGRMQNSETGPKSVGDVLEGATPGRETKGRSDLFDKPGGEAGANSDFDSMNPSNVKDIPGGGRTGQLPDGRTAVVRPGSSDGRPTLEIQSGRGRIKIRYGP